MPSPDLDLSEASGGTFNVSPPNGCTRCGELERGHAQQYNDYHNTEVGTRYAAPPDWLRKHRLGLVRLGRRFPDRIKIVKVGW